MMVLASITIGHNYGNRGGACEAFGTPARECARPSQRANDENTQAYGSDQKFMLLMVRLACGTLCVHY
jgi:hypothetical protein